VSKTGKVRVLVVDDSAFARKVLREALSGHPGIDVVGVARDGLEALEKSIELEPDVMTLDLVMPELDGLGVLRALDPEKGPRVVVVSISDAESALGIEALELGAIDIVQKPTALATDRLFELAGELCAKVLVAAGAARARPAVPQPSRPAPAPRARARGVELVVIGTSTGGPQALSRLIPMLPVALPVSVVIALHIPAGYTDALARRLNEASAVTVVEASDEPRLLTPGTVVLARGGSQFTVARRGGSLVALVDHTAVQSPYSPSVDHLFCSAAREVGDRALGVVLTGMGDDGLAGSRAIRSAGGEVLAESESSCVVYGMPRAVAEAGLASASAPLDEMAELILSWL
jgi:two-component system chemotaxis response regulator CheB